jgi:hypothetical protein
LSDGKGVEVPDVARYGRLLPEGESELAADVLRGEVLGGDDGQQFTCIEALVAEELNERILLPLTCRISCALISVPAMAEELGQLVADCTCLWRCPQRAAFAGELTARVAIRSARRIVSALDTVHAAAAPASFRAAAAASSRP